MLNDLVGFNYLKVLDLRGVMISDKGLKTLGLVKSLGTLHIDRENVTENGVKHVRDKLSQDAASWLSKETRNSCTQIRAT